MSREFDAVVVGAGPAGSTAALVLANAGKRVALVERGPFAGSKNMYGGVVYGRVLDRLIPRWWEEIPVQRWVTRRATVLLTETQSLTIDFRSQRWGAAPYNGCTTFRPDFDSWLAGRAEAAGATLITSTTATGLLRDEGGRVHGVSTDRSGGDLEAPMTIACDGVNSFLAKEAGLYHHSEPSHYTLGVKEVLALPRAEIEARFALTGDEGADFEILGGTGGVPGGAFLYTNAESISVGVVLQLSGLGASKRRPEEFIDAVKSHAAIAPLVAGGELKEHSAHLIPEGGYDAMPEIATDGLLIAGDAAGLCLAAGIWLEGVNFAIGSGKAAAETALDALRAGDSSLATLGSYRRRIEANFVLRDHKKLREAPKLVLSDRVQHAYPGIVCDMVESLFTVDNPRPKVGGIRAAWRELRRSNVRLRDAAKDAWSVLRTYG